MIKCPFKIDFRVKSKSTIELRDTQWKTDCCYCSVAEFMTIYSIGQFPPDTRDRIPLNYNSPFIQAKSVVKKIPLFLVF